MGNIRKTKMKGYLPFIRMMYALGVILVVFGHSHPLHCDYPSVFNNCIVFIYTFHMPLFFMIGGILVRYTIIDKHQVLNWWLKKVRRLIIPYVALTAIAIVPKFMLGNYVNDNMELSLRNIIKIVLIPRENIWGHFWFIPVFLILELIGMMFNILLVKFENNPYKCRALETIGGGV